jgi:hypothetical protein
MSSIYRGDEVDSEDTIRAGAIILKDLRLFNETVIFFERKIEPRIRHEIESLVNKWAENATWKFWGDLQDVGLFVAPPDWFGDAGCCLAQFAFGPRSQEERASYYVAEIFGEGETDWGFWFYVEPRHFEGKKKWNAFAKTLNQEIDELGKIGWIHMGCGEFFLPSPLSSASLPSAWENEDWEESLSPIKTSMDALVSAKTIFDGLIDKAKSKAKSEGQ